MELWDIYDEHRRLLGRTKSRTQPLVGGEYHLVAFAVILNSRDELLLTLRAPQKHSYPNLWGNTGGAVLAGETTRQAIVREVFEEIGIRAEEADFVLLDTDYRSSSHSLTDVFFLRSDTPRTALRLQAEEVSDARWLPIEQAEEMMATGLVARPDAERWPEIKQLLQPYFSENASAD